MEKQFTEAVIGSFNKAFRDAAPEIIKMLLAQRDRNQQTEEGVQQTVMTLTPKIRIELNNADGFTIEAKVQGKRQEVVTSVCKVSFDPNQPELNFEQAKSAGGAVGEDEDDGDENKVPDEDTFYDLVTENSDLDDEMLDKYFAGSDRWKDYAGWIAAGNGSEAIAILDDPERLASFAEVVHATLKPVPKKSKK